MSFDAQNLQRFALNPLGKVFGAQTSRPALDGESRTPSLLANEQLMLHKVSQIAATILPFMGAIYQLMMAFDNRHSFWKCGFAILCSALLLYFGRTKAFPG